MASGSDKFDLYLTIAGKIDAELEKGVVPWRKPWATTFGVHRNAISGRPYRGINQMLLSLTDYTQPLWLTNKALYARGGSPKPEQKRELVTLWKRGRRQPKEGEVADADGKVAYATLRYYLVWNVEQCYGTEDLYLPPSDEVVMPIEAANSIVRHYPHPKPIMMTAPDAWYMPARDIVGMPQPFDFPVREDYWAVFFHELGHSTGHPNRLARDEIITTLEGDGKRADGDYSREELVAEFTSAMLCGVAGIDTAHRMRQSASYIDHWRSKIADDKGLLVSAAARAQRAADFIQGVTFDNTDGGDSRETH